MGHHSVAVPETRCIGRSVKGGGRVNVYLLSAGIISAVLGAGHSVVGQLWVLPRLLTDSLPPTPFERAALTESFIKAT